MDRVDAPQNLVQQRGIAHVADARLDPWYPRRDQIQRPHVASASYQCRAHRRTEAARRSDHEIHRLHLSREPIFTPGAAALQPSAARALFTSATIALRTSSLVAIGSSNARRAAFGPFGVLIATSKP